MDGARRPAKRQRIARPHQPSPAAVALLERIASIRLCAVELRDDHQVLIDDFDRRASARRAASRAAAKVTRGPPADDVQKFARGDIASKPQKHLSTSHRRRVLDVAATPAMALLVEQETPEKAVVESSVIRRALMINRRNAELAKERLPKQPEAQRGKTHWDYVLDETVWLPNDFREGRKWKNQKAQKGFKMGMQ